MNSSLALPPYLQSISFFIFPFSFFCDVNPNATLKNNIQTRYFHPMAPHPTTASALFAPCFCAQISFKVPFFCSLILSLFATIIVTTIADSFRWLFLYTRVKDHHTLSCFSGLLSPVSCFLFPVSCFLLMICLFMCTVKGFCLPFPCLYNVLPVFHAKDRFFFFFFWGIFRFFLHWLIMLSRFLTGFPFLFFSFCFFGGV